MAVCNACQGLGHVTCDWCDGTGDIERDCPHCNAPHPCHCEKCDRGQAECDQCAGTGEAEEGDECQALQPKQVSE
jgi:hypothetical protein